MYISRILLILLCSVSLLFCTNVQLSELLKKADQNNPEIKAAQAVVNRYNESVRLENINWIPDIRIGGGIDSSDNRNTYSNWSIGITQLFGQGCRVQMAKEMYSEAQANLEKTRRQVFDQVRAAYEEYSYTGKLAEIYQRSFKSGLEKLAIAKRFFASGNLKPQELMNAQDYVSGYEIKIEETKARLSQIESKLTLLTGVTF